MTENAEKLDVGCVAREWWRDLAGIGTNRGRDRAAFAELRRGADPLDIAFVTAFGKLRLGLKARSDWALRKTAMIAHVLAHVREDDERPVAKALGPAKKDDDAVMSQSRFRRLLQARDEADLTRRLVRAVKMLKGRANVADLASAVWWWNDRTRRDWAFRYLDAEPPDSSRDAA